jgi:hypothetical protein
MTKAIAVLAAMLATSAFASDEYLYIYVSYKGADGTSARHRLECADAECKAEIKGAARPVSLSGEQRAEVLKALQAETTRFVLQGESAPADNPMKLKIKYETPQRRLSIERRVSMDDTGAVSQEMRGVLAAFLGLELHVKVPDAPAPEEEAKGGPEPDPKI